MHAFLQHHGQVHVKHRFKLLSKQYIHHQVQLEFHQRVQRVHHIHLLVQRIFRSAHLSVYQDLQLIHQQVQLTIQVQYCNHQF